MQIEPFELRQLLSDAAELGANRALESTGLAKTFLSQRQAYKLFGIKRVKRWHQEGLVKRYKDGDKTSTIRYNRLELETLAMSSNRATYLSTEELKQLKV